MSTWSLEHIPAAGGASTFATLTVWGIASGALSLRNWDADELTLTRSSGTALLDDEPWGFRDKLILWRDGVRVFHGWLVQPTRSANTSAEARTLRVAGPWWWLANTPIRDPDGIKDYTYGDVEVELPGGGTLTWHRATGCTWETPAGDIVWSVWDDQSTVTVQGQIRRALYSAIWAGAPIAIGTIGLDAPAPAQDARNATCAAWMQSAAQYSPYSVGWWDYSGEVPALMCAPRSGVTPQTYDLDEHPAEIGITALHDRQVHRILIRYWYTVTTEAGYEAESYYDDEAGDSGWPAGPGALIVDVESSTRDAAGAAWYVGVAAKLYADLSTLAYAGTLPLDEPTQWYRPGHSLNVSSGRTEWASMAAIVQQVDWSIQPASVDRCTITFGPPDHLGVADWLELSRIGRGAGNTSGKTGTETATPKPLTYDDLMPGGPAAGYTPAWTIEDQQRGADCLLHGYEEYTDPSYPTRYYLTETLSGGSHADAKQGASELLWTHKTKTIWGANTVSPDTGSVTSTKRVREIFVSDAAPATNYDTTSAGENIGAAYGAAGGTQTTTQSKTVISVTCSDSYLDPDHYTNASGTSSQTLTSENTEEAEIARKKAALEWEPASASEAYYHDRGGLRGFLWRMIRRRVATVSGLKPWGTYLVGFTTETRLLGSTGDWVAGPTISVAISADSSGNASASDWAELEAERGYAARWGTLIHLTPQ